MIAQRSMALCVTSAANGSHLHHPNSLAARYCVWFLAARLHFLQGASHISRDCPNTCNIYIIYVHVTHISYMINLAGRSTAEYTLLQEQQHDSPA